MVKISNARKLLKIDSWTLFKTAYKINDEVIVIDDDDNFRWGKLTAYDDKGITLERNGTENLSWDKIIFICHDGFPVKKLNPKYSDDFIDLLLATPEVNNFQQLLRHALTKDVCIDCDELAENSSTTYAGRCNKCDAAFFQRHARTKKRSGTSFRMSDPIEISNVTTEIFNPGNVGDYFNYTDDTFIEIVQMTSVDGLIGQLYGLETTFAAEGINV